MIRALYVWVVGECLGYCLWADSDQVCQFLLCRRVRHLQESSLDRPPPPGRFPALAAVWEAIAVYGGVIVEESCSVDDDL
ncbi:hypothetical protein B2J88_49700 [Rhodococcus sp. SRB_17]|nr:hypothetical protein [Rhodococcus sp. SRB_17]